jgi:hypothetical protein
MADSKVKQIENNLEYHNEGVNYIETEEVVKKIHIPTRGRKFSSYTPKIYVDDGSNGSNLVNTYSYKNYNFGEKPSVTNNYTNNYKRSTTAPESYDATDGTKLHPTGDSGAYSNFTISYFKP